MNSGNFAKKAFAAKNRMMGAGLVAVVASGGIIWGASNAAFTGSTSNEGSTWDAAEIALVNNQATALFAPQEISPGYTEDHCITITSTSTKDAIVKVYTEGVVSGSLADNLLVTVSEGKSGVNTAGVNGKPGTCTGFVPDGNPVFSGTLGAFAGINNYAIANGGVTLAPGASKQYRISAALPANAPNSLEGTATGASFVWEAQG